MISPKILFIEKRISSGVEFIQKCAIFMRESGEEGVDGRCFDFVPLFEFAARWIE